MAKKYSDLKITKRLGKSVLDFIYFGEVTETSGVLWWKKSRVRPISREYGGSWVFMDTAESTFGLGFSTLEDAFRAKERLENGV